jgi:tripartite-type tricarboxylate transporter receptor subunit TctC
MAPAGTPQPILDLLNREITTIVERPDIKAAWAKQGATAMTMSEPQFRAFMQDQITKWAKVIVDNHIRPIN